MRTTVMEIDTNNLKHNIKEIKKYVKDKKVMPVIKANGYGTYINELKNIFNEFEIVAVALVSEGVHLRKIGYTNDILVLNQPYIDELEEALENNLTIGLSEISFLNNIKNINKKLKVHIEIDTGMNRTGIKKENTESFIKEVLKNKNIEIEGIYTHLSSADYDDEYTKFQFDNFEESVKIASQLTNLKYIHSQASNGLLNYKNELCNTVRAGIILYGYDSFDKVKELIDIKPIAKLKSKITFLKEVDENTSIGYSRKYITSKKTKVATIPIGYADGLDRNLTNKEVIINGKRAKIIGNICMDSFMADITKIDANIGDEVYIWDNENITLDEIANNLNTINYEVISRISDRVPRIFI